MMTGFAAFVAITLLCALPAPALPSPPRGMPPALDRYIAKAVREWDVPGLAIVIVKDDQVLAARGYGVRELGKPEQVDGETIFDIASLAKSFTAAGAAVLVDEGRLGWDDRVRERLPAVTFSDPYIDHEVTLRDLLSHRTGLQPANAMFRFTGYDRSEVLHRVRFLAPRTPFRADMVYSNVLYTVAGELTAAAAGTTWAELIRHRLLEPAGMLATTVETRPSGPNVARPHAVLGGVQQPIRPFDYTMVGPSSSIFTNAVDLARWLRLQLNDGLLDGRQIVSRASMTEMHSPQIIIRTTPEMRRARLVEHFASYGLGWQVMDYRGEPMLWHSGNADGMPSYMALLPKQKLGVAVLINTWGAPTLHGALAARIIDTYLGAPPRDWSGEALTRNRGAAARDAETRRSIAARQATAPKAERPPEEYAGVYEATLYGNVHVRVEAEALTLQMAEGEVADLSPWDHDTFLVTWRDPVFREDSAWAVFSVDDDGHVSRLSMSLGQDKIEAARRP
jgi:CubicO group peptidase (beta-lactamase class C family)